MSVIKASETKGRSPSDLLAPDNSNPESTIGMMALNSTDDAFVTTETNYPYQETLYLDKKEGLRHNHKGWAVVVSSFLVNFFTLGVLFQWGNYQQFYLKAYHGQTDTFRISFVGTMGSTLLLSSSVLLPPLIHIFGYRRTMSVGALMAPLGLILASFSTQLWHIYLSQGVLFGLGCGFCYSPSIALPSLWFKRNRALATGIAASGSGIGALVISPLTERLIATLGYRMALRIEGVIGFGLLTLAVALAFSNPDRPTEDPPCSRPPFKIIHRELFHYDYLILLGFCMLCYFGFFGPLFLAPQYTAFLGYGPSDGAAMIAIMSGMNSLSRIIMGFLADRCGSINVMFLCSLAAGLFTSVLWQFSTSYGTYVVYCVLNGFTGGAFVSLLPVVTVDIVGVENLQQGVGLCYLTACFGNLVGSPISGKLLEKLGWIAAIQFLGISTLFSAMVLFLLRIKRNGEKIFIKV